MVLIILLCAEQRARLCASLACATWLLFGPVYVVALVRVPAVYLTCMYTYTYVRMYVRTYTCMQLCAFEHVLRCTVYITHCELGMNEWLRHGPASAVVH